MKFIDSRKLKKYNREILLKRLDDENIIIKNHNIIEHLIKLINYDFLDDEIVVLMKRYAECDILTKTSHSKESFNLLYGNIKGPILYEEYKKHSSTALSIAGKESYKNGKRKAYFLHFFPEYWINKGFSVEEAIEKVNERKKKAAAESIKAVKNGNRITCTQLEYYINQGFSEDDAKELLKKRQNTISLKSFQKRYGNEEGLIRFNNRNKKWLETLNNKSGEEKQKIYEGRVNGFIKAHTNTISNEETAILDLLEKKFNIKIQRQFSITYENKIYLFDGKYKNILIEFNGNYWHCNPSIYNESYFHTVKEKTAREIWEYDKFKQDIVGKDYKKFIIWESELNDTDKIFERFRLYL